MSDIDALGDVEGEEALRQPSLDIFDSEENMQSLVDYLVKELGEVSSNAGRDTKIERNKTIARQRLAQPESETKDFPWENASNIEPTFALQKTNIIVTKIVQSFKQKKPLFIYEAPEPHKKHAEALTRFVQVLVESPFGINLYAKLWSIVYNCVSYGTQFLKVPFNMDILKFKRMGSDGSEELVEQIIKAIPDISVIPFEDFMTRAEWSDVQKAPWVGVRYYRYTHELRALQQQGYYLNVDQVINAQQTLDDSKVTEFGYLGIDVSGATDPENYRYPIYEVNVAWDADGDGFPEDISVHIEIETGIILRAEYNDIGRRDYIRMPYIEIPGSLYGLGVGDIMLPLQDEAASLHNMRNDSLALSLRPFIVSAHGSDIGKKRGIYPGAVVKTASPREDIVITKFPDVSNSSLQAEQLLKSYADEATGASDILSGNDAGGSNRIGSSGTQFLAGQSNTLLDAIADNMSVAMSEIAMLILFQLVRNGEFVDIEAYGLSASDKIYITEILAMNVEDIYGTFQFTSRVSSITDSPQAKQQQATGLFQLYTMYVDKIIQLAAQLDNPQLQQAPKVQEAVQTAMVGLTTLIESAMADFDTDNVGDFTIYIDEMKQVLRMVDDEKGQQLDGIQAQMAGSSVADTGTGLEPEPAGGGGGSDIMGPQPGSDQGSAETIGGPGEADGGQIL